ncbi:MAG: hypothetical protein L0027_01480 [Candidatus Rokubacteria bacterium]|nr:hypothetical protein [Candidatus Rokubacteria bacterium]
MNSDFDEGADVEERVPDRREEEARRSLEDFFEANRDRVYFSRQIEVQNEDTWYQWISNRALRELIGRRVLSVERRPLASGGAINLVWHKGYRYYRRGAKSVVGLVEAYSDPNIGGALGLHGEAMVLEGFARGEFVMRGRNTRSYGGQTWGETGHDLDFIFERDGVGYGVEVKNTLRYMDHDELKAKLRMCGALGLKPVFAVRMLPKSWIKEVVDAGGFALILKYQLYPWTHRDLASRVKREFGLPVDAPRALEQGTMDRFLRWHRERV